MGPLGHSLAALAALVAAPVGAAALLVRPTFRTGVRERLGGAAEDGKPVPPGSVWVHAASVGEILSSLPVLDGLAAAGRPVLASTQTTTGRAALAAVRPDVPVRLAPLDHPWSAAAALDRVRPCALVVLEAEILPSWIRAAHDRDVPVVFVSARMSERSYRRWQRLRFVLAPTFARIRAVGARSREDAERFLGLGLAPDRLEVTGDLKLVPPASEPAPSPELARALGDVPLLVAGSTHAGEEEAALAALDAVARTGCEAALVLAPRHPERFEAVASLVAASHPSHRLLRRSALGREPLRPREVLLLDSVGELAAVYAAATLAFVGGSLAPVGGHNVLEPAHCGCPVVVGPHTESKRRAVEILREVAALECVADAAGLGAAAVEAFRDPEAARRRGAAGRARLTRERDTAERSLALIERALSPESTA